MSYCSSCGYGNSSGASGYSSLESKVSSYSPSTGYSSSASNSYEKGDISYMIAESVLENPVMKYDFTDNKKELYSNSYKSKPVTQTYSHVTDNFLALDRPRSVFIGDASEIKEFVEEAFRAVTGREFPDDVMIRLLSKEEFKKANIVVSGKWNDGLQGFAINRKRLGLVSEIFVRKGEMDKIMLTIGHELGHVLTRQLEDKRDEEAKAFAFSIAWMRKIKELNIANLATAIQLDRPARNGLHDVALDFVLKLTQEGREAFDIYLDLISGNLEVKQNA